MSDVFLICSVRNASDELKSEMADYVKSLEDEGTSVYYPVRDTDQTMRGIDICRKSATEISKAKEVHVFYLSESQGTHFDMGISFVLNKPIHIVKNVPLLENGKKCYQRVLVEWEKEGAQMQTLTWGQSMWGKINPVLGGK